MLFLHSLLKASLGQGRRKTKIRTRVVVFVSPKGFSCMKKKFLIGLIALAAMMVSTQASAETWIVYKFNGAIHVYHTDKNIDCDTFVPGPGVEIVDCFH